MPKTSKTKVFLIVETGSVIPINFRRSGLVKTLARHVERFSALSYMRNFIPQTYKKKKRKWEGGRNISTNNFA